MKKIVALAYLLYTLQMGFAQQIPFEYSLKLKPIGVSNLPGIHSYAFAQANGKWLLIGGRKDGIHARQPFSAFPATNSNTDIYVVDIQTKQFWTASVNVLATGLKEQLQSTNMNFYQDHDSLYIAGGYGYSATAADHITYPNLTSVAVSGLINAIVNGNPITSYFKQITDQNFAVNGGHLAKIDSTFYLVGGHRFDGRYNPMNNPTYTQTYVDGIKKFILDNSGNQLTYSNYTLITDQVHLHRRDYNLVPQIFPNGEEGYTISSGVFQVSVNLPFLYPVDIKSSGYSPITSFNQYLSNYHSAVTALYDSVSNTMHSIFYGGMAQYSYVNNVLTQDVNVPFVKTISRVSRDANGNLLESVFPMEMPSLLGASSEFIPNNFLSHYENEVIKLSQINTDSVLLGHIVGGIQSSQTNPFTNNNTSATNASSTIYEVWLFKNSTTGIHYLDGTNPIEITVFPNPSKKELNFKVTLPYDGDIHLLITDICGKLIEEQTFRGLVKGQQTLDLRQQLTLVEGIYSFNFLFDGKYTAIEKVVISK